MKSLALSRARKEHDKTRGRAITLRCAFSRLCRWSRRRSLLMTSRRAEREKRHELWMRPLPPASLSPNGNDLIKTRSGRWRRRSQPHNKDVVIVESSVSSRRRLNFQKSAPGMRFDERLINEPIGAIVIRHLQHTFTSRGNCASSSLSLSPFLPLFQSLVSFRVSCARVLHANPASLRSDFPLTNTVSSPIFASLGSCVEIRRRLRQICATDKT